MAQVNLGRVVGYSAYEIAVQEGFVGTEAEWLASLKGATGAQGPQGEQGPQGAAGPTYTAGTGISIENNVISATGGSGGGMDEDDVKDLIYEEYGMRKSLVESAERVGSFYRFDNVSLGDTLDVSFDDIGIWVSSINDFRVQYPTLQMVISSFPDTSEPFTIELAPGEGGMGGQDYQAYLVNGSWVAGVPESGQPTMTIGIVFQYSVDETTMEQSNFRINRVYARDEAFEEISGDISAVVNKYNYSKLNNGYIDNQTWATQDLVYNWFNQQKADQWMREVYGAAPGTEEWRIWEEEAVIDGGSVDISINHDPFNSNNIDLIQNNSYIGYFAYSGNDSAPSFIYWDSSTGAESTDFGLTYPDEGTLHLTGADGTYTLRQDYVEQIAPIPLDDEYAPQGVLDDIDSIYGSLDRIDGDIANIISVPTASRANEGDILTVNRGGDPVWATPTREIPSYDSSTIGKVLGVQQQDLRSPAVVAELAWVDKPESVPDYDRAREGDVLSINGRGDMEWMPAASGGGDVEDSGIDEAPTREGEQGETQSYKAPASRSFNLEFNHETYESVDSGDVDENENPVYEWQRTEYSHTILDSDNLTLNWSDETSGDAEGLVINSGGLEFTVTENVEVSGGEGEDPTIEPVTNTYIWSKEGIQLRDQTSGDIYELSISNGQIVLTNVSM